MNRCCRLAVAGIVALMPLLAKGQTTNPMAKVSGVVVDSVNGGYLKGALVFVSGTLLSGITDSTGSFAIDSIPPGSRNLEIQHPLLDTLGVTVITPRMDFTSGGSLSVVLSTPSPDRIIALKCSVEDRGRGSGALLGSVADPDALLPVAEALVTLDWTDVEIDGKSLTRKPRRASATTRSDGSFRICGLPEEFTANLRASAGADSTATVGVSFQPRFVFVNLTLGRSAPQNSSSRSDSARARGATLRGRIVNSKGQGISGARVSVDDRDPIAITGDNGQFVLAGLPSGTRLLTARRIGFEPVELVVRLSSVRETGVTVVLNVPVQTLDAVRVTALSRVGLSARGFYDRQRGGKGRFFDPEYLAKARPFHLNEVLVPLAFVREVPNPRIHGTTTVAARNRWECIEYVVDGRPWLQHLTSDKYFFKNDSTLAGGTDRGSPNEWIRGNEIAAIEAYPPGQAPPEIQRMTTQSGVCSTFVIWTKWKIGVK